MLRDGALPDALGQRLGLPEPDVNVDAAGIEGPENFGQKITQTQIFSFLSSSLSV